ncbi:hypothetical protein SV7mr_14940 [Stieleria bergensis]|uniref:3-keto-disaccharide hydrolase domain-containing protein n=2 Tax=Stieleria bergensis TaxID=2528025 RepID=A0A517SS87_9BACT|nr:hypothetical protein SV7mr_14940 [Planctomycetes bacterium SV_7m_r]
MLATSAPGTETRIQKKIMSSMNLANCSLLNPLRPFMRPLALAALGIVSTVVAVPSDGAEPADESADQSVVFEENFENGIERWEVLDPKTWKLSKRDGSMTLEITARSSEYKPPHRSPLHIALIKDLTLESFEMTFKVKSTKDTGNHRDCCVFFNYSDNQHFYYAHLGARPDPNSGQIMVVNEAARKNLTENKNETPWDSQWHQVKVVRDAASGKIEIYFDDMSKPHMSVTDKTFTKGRIGIGSFDDLNAFDEIVIRKR